MTTERVRKFVLNQKRGHEMNPARQVFVFSKGRARAVKVGRESLEERMNEQKKSGPLNMENNCTCLPWDEQ